MAESVNTFDILKTMSEKSMDIRGFNIYESLANIRIVGKGKSEHGKITLVLDPKTANQIIGGVVSGKTTLIGMLVIADKQQFESIKDELSNT